MPVTHIHTDSEFTEVFKKGGGDTENNKRLFVVDFGATWCGPCRNIEPLFEKLSDKYGHQNLLFIHVDVDECSEVAQEHGVRALPTFVFFNNSPKSELCRIQGANAASLEAKITELAPKFQAHFVGEGNKLGGSSSANVPGAPSMKPSSTSLSPDEIIQIAQASVEYGLSTCTRVGIRFQPPIPFFSTSKPMVRINGSDPISNLRLFVDSLLELSGVAGKSYQLHNSYPPGLLDEEKSVNDGGVAGSAVIVKFT